MIKLSQIIHSKQVQKKKKKKKKIPSFIQNQTPPTISKNHSYENFQLQSIRDLDFLRWVQIFTIKVYQPK